ncbi:MAG: hypothetical protein JSU82_17640 [Rhodospirillales bacterium]|nr:MAG: hypothetical protein JSU82_17640 [Rhodospirillales bacterium]
MIEHLPWPLRGILEWQRRRFFREEAWRFVGPATRAEFVAAVEAIADNGLPLLLTLPRLWFNRPFVGRVRDGRVTLKHRTRAPIWPIGPGSYYFSGHIAAREDGGVAISGRYRLRPTLAVMYYAYLTSGFAFLGLAIIAALAGTVAWAAIAGIPPTILLSGSKMLAVSLAYLAVGWLHITFEKWLDDRNRRAVRTLLRDAARSTGAPPGP